MLLIKRLSDASKARPCSASLEQRHVPIAATVFDVEEEGKTGHSHRLSLAAQLDFALFDGLGSCVCNNDDLPSQSNNELKLDRFRSSSPQLACKRCHYTLSCWRSDSAGSPLHMLGCRGSA